MKDACNTLTHAVTNGFPAPDGKSRVIPDRDFMSSLAALAKSADQRLQDVRKEIGESVLKHFLAKNIAISPALGVASPEHSRLVEREAPLLAEAIAHAEKLFNEKRVVAKDDFEKKDVQQSLLSREVNAGNPVKPVGDFQLQRKEGVDAKKCVVTVARLQTSSIFMRDMYGRVNKKDWFK